MAARSLNRVMLIGNLTRDPELRYTPQGTAVCTFGLATNRSWMPAEGGERQEDTEFHRIVAWSKLAEICSQLLYKGRKVYVEGRLQTREWTTADGQSRQTTEVVIDNMIALDSPRGARQEGDYLPPEAVGQAGGSAARGQVADDVTTGYQDEVLPEETPAEGPGAAADDSGAITDVAEAAEAEKETVKKVGKKGAAAKTKKAAAEQPADENVGADDIPF